MNIETIVSALSAIAALLSALYAFRSNVLAKKALALAEDDYYSKKENFKLYLIEGINYLTKEGIYIFAFNVSVINKSTINNTIFRIELIINFIRDDESIGKVILQHNGELSSFIKGHNVSPFNQPTEVAAKSSLANWCLFTTDNKLADFGVIKKYTLKVTDTFGNITSTDSYIVKEYRIV